MTAGELGDEIRIVHVVGRTPGIAGKAPMVAVAGGMEHDLPVGSHHEAVYYAAIIAMAQACLDGITRLKVTTPSEHLVYQMRGEWKIGPELRTVHKIARELAALFEHASFELKL